jgi:hypothetical protein
MVLQNLDTKPFYLRTSHQKIESQKEDSKIIDEYSIMLCNQKPGREDSPPGVIGPVGCADAAGKSPLIAR